MNETCALVKSHQKNQLESVFPQCENLIVFPVERAQLFKLCYNRNIIGMHSIKEIFARSRTWRGVRG